MNDDDQERRLLDWLNRHRGLLTKVSRSFTSSVHDQRDLFQEITFQVWKSIPAYRPPTAETTWIYRVALYTAINWSRKERTRVQRHPELPGEWAQVAMDDSRDDPRLAWLYERIYELEPIDRSLTLLLLDGFSYREMSEALGISTSHVGVKINRIKQKLSRQLQREQTT